MRKLALLLLCALAVSACVPTPVDVDTIPNFDPEETVMGRIQQDGVLEVGVPEHDWAPFWLDPDGDLLVGAGFIVGLSQDLGTALGVDVEYVPLDEDDIVLPGRLGEESPVDISFAPLPATEELAKAHPLTHPYWVAHQRLLVPSDSGIEQAADLDGPYCTIIDETTGLDLAGITGTTGTASDIEGCARLLESGKVDAVTAPDMFLMSVWATLTDCEQPCEPSSDYEIVGDELTTAGYSAMLPLGSPGWTSFVNETWGETDVEGRWLEYYEEWIAPYGIELAEPPDMRIEEAAGLFPCEC